MLIGRWRRPLLRGLVEDIIGSDVGIALAQMFFINKILLGRGSECLHGNRKGRGREREIERVLQG